NGSGSAGIAEVSLDETHRLMSGRFVDANLVMVVEALKAIDIETSVDATWMGRRFNTEFKRLPIDKAIEHIFGNAYVLGVRRDPQTQAISAYWVRLLALDDTHRLANQIIEKLERMAANGDPGLSAALEEALKHADGNVRQAALRIAMRSAASVSSKLLEHVVKEDADPTVRIAALQHMMNRGDAGVAWRVLGEMADGSLDPHVRKFAETSMASYRSQVLFLYNRDLAQESSGASTALNGDLVASNDTVGNDLGSTNNVPKVPPEVERDVIAGNDPINETTSEAAKTYENASDEERIAMVNAALGNPDPMALFDLPPQALHGVDATRLLNAMEQHPDALARKLILSELTRRPNALDEAWDALTYTMQNDPDPNNREYAAVSRDTLARQADWLYNRDLYRENGVSANGG
ncbi:MAG: HEAT repeat domain-containing protein, partial [Gammaproteobacteria bacterium]|nr:HEAT repeat domain-containing protein [Gammaproteobacteria bacterium]